MYTYIHSRIYSIILAVHMHNVLVQSHTSFTPLFFFSPLGSPAEARTVVARFAEKGAGSLSITFLTSQVKLLALARPCCMSVESLLATQEESRRRDTQMQEVVVWKTYYFPLIFPNSLTSSPTHTHQKAYTHPCMHSYYDSTTIAIILCYHLALPA